MRMLYDVVFVSKPLDMKRLSGQPNYHSYKKINDDYVACYMIKDFCELNRPIAIGFSILGRNSPVSHLPYTY